MLVAFLSQGPVFNKGENLHLRKNCHCPSYFILFASNRFKNGYVMHLGQLRREQAFSGGLFACGWYPLQVVTQAGNILHPEGPAKETDALNMVKKEGPSRHR